MFQLRLVIVRVVRLKATIDLIMKVNEACHDFILPQLLDILVMLKYCVKLGG
jgi:hypothetical protein